MKRSAILLTVILCITTVLSAQDAFGSLNQLRLFGDSENLSMTMRMEIQENSSTKERIIVLKMSHKQGADRSLVTVSSPAFLSKLAFLRIRDGKGLRQWLRTSSSVQRLADGNRKERLFGSDFTAGDFSDLGEEILEAAFIADSPVGMARISARASWGHRIISFNPEDTLVREVDYLDNAGTLIKRYRVKETTTIGGKLYPQLATMETIGSNSSTTISLLEVDDKTIIAERYFNPGAL